MSRTSIGSPPRGLGAIPRGVWALGFVSLFMDMSSELVHGLLPIFMVGTLGASIAMVGLIEGVAEATALIAKVFSGAISDWMGRRKLLIVFGYGLGALSKPLFALAASIDAVLIARFADRIGKGIRGAPRDAMVADLVTSDARGAAYGLRQSLDTIGAFIGPLLAVAAMVVLDGDIRSVLWLAVLPAVVSVTILVLLVKEPRVHRLESQRVAFNRAELAKLDRAYWSVVTVGGVFTLARFSEAFLVLRAADTGLPDTFAPLVLVVMSVVYATSAYPAGALADRMNRDGLLAIGLLVLVAADVALALSTGLIATFVGVALWGLHMGLTQGLLATLVADAAPDRLRGTAFGVFNLVSGVVLLVASFGAGLIWEALGAAVTFWSGAVVSLAALGAIVLRRHVVLRG